MKNELKELIEVYLPDISSEDSIRLSELQGHYHSDELIEGVTKAITGVSKKFIVKPILYLQAILEKQREKTKAVHNSKQGTKSFFPNPFCDLCGGLGGTEVMPAYQSGYRYSLWKQCSCVGLKTFQEYEILLEKKYEQEKKAGEVYK